MRKSTRHVACDICHFKKRHCDGEQPCYQCVNRGLECSYDRKMKRARSSSNPPQPAAAAANSNTTNPTTTQQNEQTSTANNNNSSSSGGINRELDFSISDWQVFRQAVTNFGELQTNTYQDFIHWDLYVEEIPIETRHLLWKLIQGKENPSQIDPCHICTAYIYCSAIAIGLDYINHPSHYFWAQRSYEMIKLLTESGGIEKLDHENQKLIVVDHILKEVYYYIKRNDFYKAIYLAWQAKLVAALTEPTITLPDQDPDIPTFIKIHLNTFKVWTVKSIKKKISTLKNCVRDISRVQTGTSVLSALLVCCESAEIYSTLMKGIRVPIDPTYAETVYEYMKSIYEIHNIQEAPADKKLIFALSLTLLNIRSEATPKTIETNLSWAYNLLSSLQNRDTNTCWLSGIGISLSLLCNSDLMFQFREYQRIISNPYYIEWQQKNGLEEKMLSHCLEQQFDDPVDLLVNL